MSSKRKSRSEKSCGGLRTWSQASAPVKPTTKSLSPLSPTQVRRELPGGATVSYHYQALNPTLGTNASNISHGGKKKRSLYSVCVHVTCSYTIKFPREEICAFGVGVVSAFCVWEPVCYGDETVPASAQPPPQPHWPHPHLFLQPHPAVLTPLHNHRQWA